uniref:4Fe-4S Mo/W bis-MGD-type domain-containing protein n=1 Tax=Amphimedon queenslandica TaxID=400682 RepID=A0A1X7TJH2_AMPQE|eukprot:XP_019859247.1 PREDICTED: uncharacterized protein LOC109587448 [Amphimedon queenslandica]
MAAVLEHRPSVCPHDCPSTCALEVEVLDGRRIGKVRGAKDHSYTAGVICSKVARYAERIHHPERLTVPLRRKGDKGRRESFVPIDWEDALDIVAEALLRIERTAGSEAIWPYYYAGTMGLVMRDGINRLRHVKRYSGQYSTICVPLAWNGFIAGTGRLAGSDPREMARSDLVVIWGTNAASTQVNVMTHALEARRERKARIVVIDTYLNATAKQADLFVCLRPGTDGALACAVMHVLFREGFADREYLARHTDCPAGLEEHLASRTLKWAQRITGVPAKTIEELARMIGATPRTYLRLGYGFSRQRNGAVNMHAAASIAAVTGAWRHEGGGAFHSNGAIYHWDKTMIEGLDVIDPSIRVFDQSRIGAVLEGDAQDIADGPRVEALLIQGTNPMMVAPEYERVRRGFARDDLFICVHEQFMTETAAAADIVLPATMFLEHDDLYQAGGQQHILLGPKVIDPPEGCRSNHEVVCALARRGSVGLLLSVADGHGVVVLAAGLSVVIPALAHDLDSPLCGAAGVARVLPSDRPSSDPCGIEGFAGGSVGLAARIRIQRATDLAADARSDHRSQSGGCGIAAALAELIADHRSGDPAQEGAGGLVLGHIAAGKGNDPGDRQRSDKPARRKDAMKHHDSP